MTQTLLATGLIVALILALSLLVMTARSALSPAKPVTLTVNGDREVTATTGERLLGALNNAGIAVPSACAGAGTCGQCRLKVTAGGGAALPTEQALLSGAQLRDGQRLACQVVIRGPLSVTVPDDILAAEQWTCEVERATQLAPLIRELVLRVPDDTEFRFRAGAYVQIEAPAYTLKLADLPVEPRFEPAWKRLGVKALSARNPAPTHRAYSIASRPQDQGRIVLDIRLALPPPGAGPVPPGIVSSYLFSLKAGDPVAVSGPFGDFFVRDTDREKVFIGGGVGMAPLRAMIHDQLARGGTHRMSFWYGARGLVDLFYREELDALAERHDHFSWTAALSEPAPEDHWQGRTGFIHEVVYEDYLKHHPAPQDCEYYLCGPPLMIEAVLAMLDELGVEPTAILNDEFSA